MEPDVDAIAHNVAQSCSTYTSTSMAKRGENPIDGATSYGSSIDQNQLIGPTSTFGIQSNPLLVLGFQPSQQSNLAFGAGPSTPVIGQNIPVSQPIKLNDVFDSQNKAITQPTDASLQTTSEISAANSQLYSQGVQIPTETTASNGLSTDIWPNSLNISPENLALETLGSHRPDGDSDATVNNQWVSQAGKPRNPSGKSAPALAWPQDSTGEPVHDCIIPHEVEDKDDIAYTVWEVTYVGSAGGDLRYPHAILLGDGYLSPPPYTKYTLTRGSDRQGLAFQKVPLYTFIDRNGIIKVYRFERRGWLVAKDGATKQQVLTWFEDIANTARKQMTPSGGWSRMTRHWTATWAVLVFKALDASMPSYWLPYKPPT
ncbi:hypothetical protein MMC07_009838, partial [Pseudocyphellaria aurata]|nr:hypothetical protein [Pseudocyphellaria aurata]